MITPDTQVKLPLKIIVPFVLSVIWWGVGFLSNNNIDASEIIQINQKIAIMEAQSKNTVDELRIFRKEYQDNSKETNRILLDIYKWMKK